MSKITISEIQKAHGKAVRDALEGNCVPVTIDPHIHRGILLLENQILRDVIDEQFGESSPLCEVIEELANAYFDLNAYMDIDKVNNAEIEYWRNRCIDEDELAAVIKATSIL